MKKHHRRHKRWKYKNTFLLVASLLLLFFIADSVFFKNFIALTAKLGYFGAFIAGFFFVSTFTIAPAGIVLFHMAEKLDPFTMSLVGGLGGLLGDYIIFHFFRDHLVDELKPIYMMLGGSHLTRLLSTPYFAWFAPFLGAIIIASPIPDELGISLMGIAKLRNWQFICISYVMNTAGILLVAAVKHAL